MHKRMMAMIALALSLVSLTAYAETTVTVDDGESVTVQQNQPGTAAAVQTVPVVQVPVVYQAVPVVILKEDEADPKNFEGTITNVDLPENQIRVRDTDGRDRKVLVKQGMISGFKVDDYVKVELMADMKEAKMIKVVR
jgi:hypothetical protein